MMENEENSQELEDVTEEEVDLVDERRYLTTFKPTVPVTLMSATPIHKFTVGQDGVESVYEERGAIIIKMLKSAGVPNVIFTSGGYAMFSETMLQKKRQPTKQYRKRGLSLGKIGGS